MKTWSFVNLAADVLDDGCYLHDESPDDMCFDYDMVMYVFWASSVEHAGVAVQAALDSDPCMFSSMRVER